MVVQNGVLKFSNPNQKSALKSNTNTNINSNTNQKSALKSNTNSNTNTNINSNIKTNKYVILVVKNLADPNFFAGSTF